MNKTAVVTGATKGLGRAIAEKLAHEGFTLCVCARTVNDLNEMAAHWTKNLPKAILYTMQADLGNKEEVVAFGKFCLDSLASAPHIVVNNTGVYKPGGVLTNDDGVLENMIEVNLYSAYYLTRTLVPDMITRGNGHIFNICSVASIIALPGGGAYTVSKFAMLGWSKTLRDELKQSGVKVTSIMPGATWSDSWKGVELPESRLMQASDIANTLWSAYQLSDSAVVEEIVLRPQLGDL
jgi:short-subunit dehydrogenase